MNIFYLDDDADDCFIMEESLKNLDPEIKCISFTEALKAIKYLVDAPVLPDLIVLDINMPVMNGKECLIKIKQHDKLKDVPVVMCSTAFRTQEMKSYFELGAYDFIVKPNNLETFYVALNSIISSLSPSKKRS